MLLRSAPFIRAAKRLVKKQPQIAKDLQITLELLTADAFHSQLRTHKLKGTMTGS